VALILNELIQNAIEHGFEEHTEGSLAVTPAESDDRVTVVVENDDAPHPPTSTPSKATASACRSSARSPAATWQAVEAFLCNYISAA
jgi:two-component sensor histidine kinase